MNEVIYAGTAGERASSVVCPSILRKKRLCRGGAFVRGHYVGGAYVRSPYLMILTKGLSSRS